MKQANIDYKHTEYFKPLGTTTKKGDLPSLNLDPDINTTIKENPYRSNVEIEGKEIVLNPDLSAIFKAKGKRHAQGGMQVELQPDSFVFSDDKNMSFNDKEHDLFELKKGGKASNPYKNTPAKVVERNIDLEHYNRLTSNLADPYKDTLAKESSALMLEKYMKTLGNIAFIQESKKGFPQGTPAFSEGTAPVYNDDLKDDIMQQKQFAKYGGTIENPYKMQKGGKYQPTPFEGITYVDERGRTVHISPDKRGNMYTGVIDGVPATWDSNALWAVQNQILPKVNMNGVVFRKPLSDGEVAYFGNGNRIRRYNNNRAAQLDWQGNEIRKGNINKDLSITWDGPQKAIVQGSTFDPLDHAPIPDEPPLNFFPIEEHSQIPAEEAQGDVTTTGSTEEDQRVILPIPTDLFTPDLNAVPKVNEQKKGIDDYEVQGEYQNGIPINWEFNPYQKISQLNDLYNLLSVKKYMPMRSRFNPEFATPNLLNPEQAVSDARAMTSQQLRAASVYNPIMRNAQSQSLYGQFLDRVPQIRSQYDNQNAAIQNQFTQYNNQLANNASTVNSQLDQQYWQELTRTNSNYDNMKTYLRNQFLSNRMKQVTDNQRLAFQLASLGPKPAYSYDFKTMQLRRNDKNIMDAMNMNGQDNITAVLEQIKRANNGVIPESVWPALIRGKYFQMVAPYLGSTPTFGSMYNNPMYNPYKAD